MNRTMNFNKSIIILYNKLPDKPTKDAEDVLYQVNAVFNALQSLGFHTVKLAFNGDFGELTKNIKAANPALVFNLVEEVSGKGKLSYLLPSYFESMNIKYTGCSGEAIMLTTNKIITKKLLKISGIPTAPWVSEEQDYGFNSNDTYIIKAVYEDGSIGLSQDSIVKCENINKLISILKALKEKTGNEVFAEKYIDGREINISILGNKVNPIVLTPCEIKFSGFEGMNKAKIFDYRAKWEEDSFEYQNIKSSNSFEIKDEELLKELKRFSLLCWQEFNLNGYGRVDYRIDSEGKPYVLELNANPCITPGDSSFIRSTEKSGLTYEEIIKSIISAI